MNKEADLRAALQSPSNSSSASSLNLAAPGGPSFQGRQSSSIVLMSSLIALYQGCDSARETTRPVAVSQMFPLCWAGLNPQLGPSAPTPEKSLHWHREGRWVFGSIIVYRRKEIKRWVQCRYFDDDVGILRTKNATCLKFGHRYFCKNISIFVA